MSGPELKPCPFCGGDAIIINEDRAWIECADCPSKVGAGPFDIEAEAIAAWNTRAPVDYAALPEVQALIAVMERALQNIVDSYEASSELHTSSADCAANLYDHACAALAARKSAHPITVQDAARVPEIAALMERVERLFDVYDESGRQLGKSERKLKDALRAITEGRE